MTFSHPEGVRTAGFIIDTRPDSPAGIRCRIGIRQPCPKPTRATWCNLARDLPRCQAGSVVVPA